jgi:hypothetical protein
MLGMNTSKVSQRQNKALMMIDIEIRSVASGNHGKAWFRDAIAPCPLVGGPPRA